MNLETASRKLANRPTKTRLMCSLGHAPGMGYTASLRAAAVARRGRPRQGLPRRDATREKRASLRARVRRTRRGEGPPPVALKRPKSVEPYEQRCGHQE